MSISTFSFPLEPIYTNGGDYYESMSQEIRKRRPALVRISSYNTSINDEFKTTIQNFLATICAASGKVELLIGVNPKLLHTRDVISELQYYASLFPNLEIRTLPGVHVKCLLTSNSIGYTGSFNLVHPTLDDLMVRLSKPQHVLVDQYFTRLWARALLKGSIVQKLNKTISPA